MVARMQLQTQQTFALFVTGSTEPSSNVGPWFKNGTELYVWSDSVGGYVPITIDPASLGYFIGSTTPDENVYQFWIETTVGGSPLALKIFYSGSWVDVYAATLAGYLTTTAAASTYAPKASPALTGTPTAPTAAPGTNTTQLATTAFVEAAVGGIAPPGSFAAYPACAVVTGQTIAIDGAPHQIEFSTTAFNPIPGPFNTGTYRYVAPADGYYNVSFASQFDNDTGAAAGMQVAVSLYKNGVFIGFAMADLDSTPSPNGDRWSPGFSGLVQLATNDYLEIFAEITDGVDAGNITLTTAQISVHRTQAV